jgi:hypothetical protein
MGETKAQLSAVKQIRGMGIGSHTYTRLEWRDQDNRSWFATSSSMDIQSEIWKTFFDQDSFPINRILNSRFFIGRQFHSAIGKNGISVSGGVLLGVERQAVYSRNSVGSNQVFTTRRARNATMIVGIPLALRKHLNDDWWIEVRGSLLAKSSTESIIRSVDRNPFQSPLTTTFSINTGLNINTRQTQEELKPGLRGWHLGFNITDLSFNGLGITTQFKLGDRSQLALDGSYRFTPSDVVAFFRINPVLETRTIEMQRLGATYKHLVNQNSEIQSYVLGRMHYTWGQAIVTTENQIFDPGFGFQNQLSLFNTAIRNVGFSTGIGAEISRNKWWLDLQLFSGYQIPDKFQGFVVLDPRLRQGSFVEFRLIVGADFNGRR